MASFLSVCLSTIVKQHYPNVNVIIVDAESSDNTPDVVARYPDLVSAYIREPDRGQAQAVTKGLQCASGDILHWHAADDVLMPNALWRVAREFTLHKDVDLVFSDGMGFDAHRIYASSVSRWVNFWDSLLFFGRFASDCAYWRKGLETRALPLDNTKPLMCDEDFFLRMWPGNRYAWVETPLGAFRSHGAQVSKTVDRTTLDRDRRHSRERVFRDLGLTEEEIARMRRRRFPHYLLAHLIAPRLYSGGRYLIRRLTLDVHRRRLRRWFFSEWLRPVR